MIRIWNVYALESHEGSHVWHLLLNLGNEFRHSQQSAILHIQRIDSRLPILSLFLKDSWLARVISWFEFRSLLRAFDCFTLVLIFWLLTGFGLVILSILWFVIILNCLSKIFLTIIHAIFDNFGDFTFDRSILTSILLLFLDPDLPWRDIRIV